MSDVEYSDLLETLNREKEKIKSHKLNTNIPLVDDDIKYISEIYGEFFNILIKYCKAVSAETIFHYHQQFKKSVWQNMVFICDLYDQITSENINWKLYYFIQDIKEDLEISSPFGIQLGNEYKIKEIIDDIPSLQFADIVLSKDAESISNIDLKRSRLIEIPHVEFDNPIGYSIIVHECFHCCEKLIEEVIHNVDKSKYDEKIEDFIVDIFSLFYCGPVYALAISKMPNKVGKHMGEKHPSFNTRISYFIQFINLLNKENVDKKDSAVYELVKSINKKVLNELNLVYDEAKVKNKEELFFNDQFEKIFDHINKIFNREKIPTYIEEINKINKYFGIKTECNKNLINLIDIWLFKEGSQKKEPFLPVKPISLLNLFVLSSNYSKRRKNLADVSFISFKKWYVIKKYYEPKQISL